MKAVRAAVLRKLLNFFNVAQLIKVFNSNSKVYSTKISLLLKLYYFIVFETLYYDILLRKIV